MLSIQNIFKSFNRKLVIKNLNLELESNESIGITGENGSGKTTLLKIISGLMRPDSGYGVLNKKPIFKLDSNYRKYICYWGHHSDSYPNMTALENISLFLHLRGDSIEKKKIYSILNDVGLNIAQNQFISEFSVGMLQRFHIARLILASWELAIMDEPTNGLDESGLILLDNSIKKFQKMGKSLIISSHKNKFIMEHCDRIYKLKNASIDLIK